jgi:hypothetical protein
MQQTKERTPATKLPTTVNDIPDHLLKLIFRRLDSHVSYLRAAAVCTSWPRIASTRGTKYRDWNHHHFLTILGHYHVADPSLSPGPRSSSQAQRRRRRVVFIPASPSIDARHFTLDFLHSGRPWELVDGCGTSCSIIMAPTMATRMEHVAPRDAGRHPHPGRRVRALRWALEGIHLLGHRGRRLRARCK